MKQIEGVDLVALVEESSKELVSAKKEEAANIIKKHLQRVEQLALDVRKAEKVLKSAQEKLKKAQDKIDKIKAGDWSLLSDKKDGPKGHNKGGEQDNNEY